MRNLTLLMVSGCALCYSNILTEAACAQSSPAPVPPPVFRTVDKNGVDLVSLRVSRSIAAVQIGSGADAISYSFDVDLPQSTNKNAYISATASGGKIYITIDGSSKTFTQSGALGSASYSSDQGDPTSLTYSATDKQFTYTDMAGSLYKFSNSSGSANDAFWLQSVSRRNGNVERYYYTYLPTLYADGVTRNFPYLLSITNSYGYQVKLGYTALQGSWYASSATAFNMAAESCDPRASSCTLSGAWPTVTRSGNTFTDTTGKQVVLTTDNSSYYRLTYASGQQETYNGSKVNNNGNSIFKVSSFSDGRGTWRYQTPSPYAVTTLAFDPVNSAPKQYQFTTAGQPSLFTDPSANGQSRYWSYDAKGRVTSFQIASASDGSTRRTIQYSYDARGNLVEERRKPLATSSGVADIVLSAHYPAICSDPGICNKPDYTIDAASARTDYSYDANSGEVSSITFPAGVAGGIRPQKRFTYTPQNALFKNGNGVQVPGDTVYRLSRSSECRTTASCMGTSDEVVQSFAFNPANALTPSGATLAAGDNSLSSTTLTTYTLAGDLQTVDGPLAGSADTSRAYYDPMRRKIGQIDVDPDGPGQTNRAAARMNYDGDGRLASVEGGIAQGIGDGDLANMSVVQTSTYVYDAQGRSVVERVDAAGAAYALTQRSYDSAGNLQCSAKRMNQGAFGNLPASACTLGPAGAAGADRITQFVYDPQFRVTSVTSAVGTSDAATERSLTYNTFGDVGSVQDGNGNRTNYSYDDFGRLSRTAYADGSYEQVSFDPNGNVSSRLLRDGNTIGYTYDRLNRTISKTPGGARSVAFAYDLLGHLTEARFDGPSGADAVLLGYDAIGRMTSSRTMMSGTDRTLTYAYDAAGNLANIVHPDGVSFALVNDNAGRLTSATWAANGASTPFYQISYDDLGRRSRTARGGSATTYGYDSVSRLSSLSQQFAGGAGNVGIGLSYNPAGQIVSRTSDNDSYAWPGAVNVDRGYTANALNQYSAVGGTAFAYDGRGNLTSDGQNTYGYDPENRMIAASTAGGTTLTYDPLGRLWQVSSPVYGKTQFLYDGMHVAAEYNGDTGAMRRRFFWGPGADEPVLQDEGGAMNCSGTRMLQGDERGSVIAASDCSGIRTSVNSYDEYGIPASTNWGRYQFTGQAWMPELGLYYYKARMYSPTLGRFMQTDPVGYADGLNWYNYVGGDPVNSADPLGLQCAPDGGAGNKGGAANSCPNDDQSNDITVIGKRIWIKALSELPSSVPFYLARGTVLPAVDQQPQNNQRICRTPLRGGRTISQNVSRIAAMRQGELDGAGWSNTEQAAAGSGTFAYWLRQVAPGGAWAGRIGEPWGNWNYGATGRAAGIPLNVLLRGAGAAEKLESLTGRTGSGNTGQGNPFGKAPYGDNPEGQKQILEGYNAGC